MSQNDEIYLAGSPNQPENTIVFKINDPAVEMLKISPEGFYVRGVKVEQDENEAQTVYDAFMDFMKQSGAIS